MQKKESELIDQAVNGDKKVLESLLLSVQDMIYNLSLRMLGSPQDAEDAVQEIITAPGKQFFLNSSSSPFICIPGTVHTDLYDRKDIIPFDKTERFFHENLKK